ETRHLSVDIRSQQDPRGSFVFTGGITGLDLADFLLGLPSTSAIATGNADKFFRGWQHSAYLADDWRVSPVLTVNAGVRWDFETPLTERLDRLVNLDIAPGFVAAAPTLASDPKGAATGMRYPRALLRSDYFGIQ